MQSSQRGQHPVDRRGRRAVWLTTTFDQAGGGERLLLEGATFFESQGIRTTVATFTFDEVALFEGAYQPRVVRLAETDPPAARGRVGALDYWLRGARRLRALIEAERPDYLIAQSENSAILLSATTLLSREPYELLLFGQMFQFPRDLTKYSLVFRRHLPEIRNSLRGYQETIPLQPRRWSLGRRLPVEVLALLRYLAVRRAAKLSTLSEQGRWEIQKLYQRDSLAAHGAYPRRIFDYRPDPGARAALNLPDGPILLTVSRLFPKKQIDLAIRAFYQLLPEMPDLWLVIGGTGPDEARLRAVARELEVHDRVIFAGFIPERRLWDAYSAADVFIQLDIADYDITTLEALALGRPVVLSTDADLAGQPVVERLITRAEPNPEAVARAIRQALATPRPPLGADERAILEPYTWESYFSRLLDFFDER